MNEVLKAIASRYSCRSFTDQIPEAETLAAIAEAGLASPSGVNRQAWRIIVVRNRALIDEMEEEGMRILSSLEDSTGYDRIMARGGKLYYNAPCMMMLPIDPTEFTGSVLDCGILCQTVALAATSLDIDNLICGFAGLAFAGDKAQYFKEALGFPPGFEFGSAVLLGYAENKTAPHALDHAKVSYVD